MKSRSLVVLSISAVFALQFAGFSAADPGEVTDPWFGVDTQINEGSVFEVRLSIRANETGDFMIELNHREEFTFTPTEKTVTINTSGDSRTFIFEGRNNVRLDDGIYVVGWAAYHNGTEFNSGSFDVRVGEQAPGFGLLSAGVLAMVAVVFSRRR